MTHVQENLETLRERLHAPCLGFLPHRPGFPAREAAHDLDLGCLLRGATVLS
jgi:hypothetical protein